MGHDVERQSMQLLQCLMQAKKPIGFLLGAGCPFSIPDESGNPLVPNIMGMTEIVTGKVGVQDLEAPLEQVCRSLSVRIGHDPSVEEILTQVRGLRDYAQGSEPTGLDETVLSQLETRICEEIRTCASNELPGNATPYHSLATWIGAIDRDSPVEIFTTNYDLLMEQALEEVRVPFFDGFVGSRYPFFDPYAIEFDSIPTRWARLWKIHGSINWTCAGDDQTFKIWRADSESGTGAVIHPSHLKYDQSRKMPYLALMDRFKNFLSTASSATVIAGYSFRDQHLNDVLVQGLQGSPSSAAFALMHSTLDSYPVAKHLAERRGNLSVFATDGAVIGTRASRWATSHERPDTDLPEGAVAWDETDEEEGVWQASLRLGDFQILGEFLGEISGHVA